MKCASKKYRATKVKVEIQSMKSRVHHGLARVCSYEFGRRRLANLTRQGSSILIRSHRLGKILQKESKDLLTHFLDIRI